MSIFHLTLKSHFIYLKIHIKHITHIYIKNLLSQLNDIFYLIKKEGQRKRNKGEIYLSGL